MLASLAERRPTDEPVALVVAHPDDETIAVGGSLPLLRRLLLVHVTDGAPLALDDAARRGFASPALYAEAREAELAAALALCGPVERLRLGFVDGRAAWSVPAITAALAAAFAVRGIRAAVTHAFEGGHPDHDALALAVHRTGVEVVEFAGYHAAPGGGLCSGRFLGEPGLEVAVPAPDRRRKAAMFACFATQADILRQFGTDTERFRRAPGYDFAARPHPGRLLYEEWGWLDFAAWRAACAG